MMSAQGSGGKIPCPAESNNEKNSVLPGFPLADLSVPALCHEREIRHWLSTE